MNIPKDGRISAANTLVQRISDTRWLVFKWAVVCLIRIITKPENIHFRPESLRFYISPRLSPGQENRSWFNGSDEVKEKRNPSSLVRRVTVKTPADLTGLNGHWTLVPPVPLCRGNSARNGGLMVELLSGDFLPLPCAPVQSCRKTQLLTVARRMHSPPGFSYQPCASCDITSIPTVGDFPLLSWKSPKGSWVYTSNNSLIHLLSLCNAERSRIPYLKNRYRYTSTKCSLVMHHTQV